MPVLKIKRGTRAQLNAAVSGNLLNQGEPYIITDEGRIAVGTGSNTYEAFAKQSEVSGSLDPDLTAIANLTGTGYARRTGADTWALDNSTFLTGNQTISISGDATGSGATAITLALASVGTAGTYTKVTTDAKGRVTAGTTLVATDIPTLTASKISDFDTQVRTSSVAQLAAPAASLSMNSQRIISLADPVGAQDAATKAYVDSVAQGLDAKASVRAATTANITLSGTQTIDGVAVIAGDRVLVKNQTTTSQNGIWVVAAGAWSRALDADTWAELVSAFTFVEEGTVNADTSWVCTVNAGGTLGTTAVTFTQFGAAGSLIAGNGLTQTGNTFDVVGTAGRISVAADSIDIDAAYVGQTSIVTLGTVTTGTWNATAIGATVGGTGQTSYAVGDILYSSATNTLAKLTKPATATSFLQMTSAGVPSWTDIVDGGTF